MQFLIIFGILGFLAWLGVGVWFVFNLLRNQEKRMSNEFEIKLASARAQSMTKDIATFEQIRTDINFIISFYIAHDIVFVADEVKKGVDGEDQLIQQFVSSISAKTLLGMSDELKRQFSLYASIPDENGSTTEEDFLSYFIRKEAFTKILTQVQTMNKGKK